MPTPDTSLGSGAGQFPQTAWSLVSKLGASGSGEHRGALEDLCRRYWKPIYKYLRIAWAKSNDDAKDLTQAFFVWLMEGEPLRQYAPERGGFRTYLKLLLKRFAGHDKRAMERVKRGGDIQLLPLDVAAIDVADSTDPEAAFDRAWLDKVMEVAMERVRDRFRAAGRESHFKLFEEYDLSDSPASYDQLAAKYGFSEGVVRNALFTIREAVRSEIRAELSELTSDPGELEDEFRALFGKP